MSRLINAAKSFLFQNVLKQRIGRYPLIIVFTFRYLTEYMEKFYYVLFPQLLMPAM